MSEVTDLVEEWSNRDGRMKLAINMGNCSVYTAQRRWNLEKSQ